MRAKKTLSIIGRRAAILALSAITAVCLAFPTLALAEVTVDGQELSQGDNSVGGGTATLLESVLDMVNVAADNVSTNEDLTINFNGGNEVGSVNVGGSASVTVNFDGENEVEDVVSADTSSVTINANGHNEFEELKARGNSVMTINVTGENDFESIDAFDNASVIVQGAECQLNDIINLGEGEEDDANIITANGDLTIDRVTINVEGKYSAIGSSDGNIVINTSKIAKAGDNEYVNIIAGGALDIIESVIDISGEVFSIGQMTINHSDVKVTDPGEDYETIPYRVLSKTGIDLIDEKNGEVKQVTLGNETVSYVDTGDGRNVDLEADGGPGYYKCKGGCDSDADAGLPATGDSSSLPISFALLALCTMGTAAIASKLTYKPRGKHAR